MPGTRFWSIELQRRYEIRSLPSITKTNREKTHEQRITLHYNLVNTMVEVCAICIYNTKRNIELKLWIQEKLLGGSDAQVESQK